MKTKIVKTLAVLLAAALMFTLVACGAKTPEQSASGNVAANSSGDATPPNRIVIQTLSDPGSYAIFDAGSSVRIAIEVLMYERLFGNYYVDEPTPVIASGYERVADGVYHITIRDGVYDTNGNPVTIDDVIWCFETMLEGGQRNSTFGNIKEIKKLDDHTFELSLMDEFVGEFRNIVCALPIISRASYEASENGFASDPVGTGPYKLKSWVQGSSIVFEKNEDYWNKENQEAYQPYDEIEFRFIAESTQIALALETGEVDMALGVSNQDVPKFTEDKGFSNVSIIDNLARILVFNCDESNPFSDVRLRQAICYALDCEPIIDAVTNGEGQVCNFLVAANDNNSFSDYNMEWNEEEPYPYNIEKAKALMAEAGYPNGLKVKLMTKDTPEFRTTCEIMQAYLAEIGIEVEILAYENALYQTYRYDPTAFDMYLGQIASSWSVVQGWKWWVTPDAETGKTVYMMDGTEFWEIYEKAGQEATHSAETVEAAWSWMKENVPMYAYGYTNKYFVYKDNFDPFITYQGFHYPWMDGRPQ